MDNYFQSALAPTSQRTYSSAQQSYLRFFEPLPVAEHQFASNLANEKLAHAPIKSYLSVIRHMQISSGLPDPELANMPKLEWHKVFTSEITTQEACTSPDNTAYNQSHGSNIGSERCNARSYNVM